MYDEMSSSPIDRVREIRNRTALQISRVAMIISLPPSNPIAASWLTTGVMRANFVAALAVSANPPRKIKMFPAVRRPLPVGILLICHSPSLI